MQTFNQKLTEAQSLQDQAKKENGGFGMKDTPHLPEVLAYLEQYRAENNRTPDQTVYNAELVEYIMAKENTPANLKRQLETQVYFAQVDYRDNLEAINKARMLDEGWQELTSDTTYRGKIQLDARVDGIMGTNHIEDTAKLITDGQGYMFIVAKGKRSRGWFRTSLHQAFYKPLNN